MNAEYFIFYQKIKIKIFYINRKIKKTIPSIILDR